MAACEVFVVTKPHTGKYSVAPIIILSPNTKEATLWNINCKKWGTYRHIIFTCSLRLGSPGNRPRGRGLRAGSLLGEHPQIQHEESRTGMREKLGRCSPGTGLGWDGPSEPSCLRQERLVFTLLHWPCGAGFPPTSWEVHLGVSWLSQQQFPERNSAEVFQSTNRPCKHGNKHLIPEEINRGDTSQHPPYVQ